MSDNLLLSSLWLLPVIGLFVVLIVPKRSEAVDQVDLARLSRWLTFLVTLVMLGIYVGDQNARQPLLGAGASTTP